MNANQVFHWRKLYQEGRLDTTTNFLPVRVASEERGEEGSGFIPQPGTMEIKLAKGALRLVGAVDVRALPYRDRVSGLMIGLRTGTRIWIAAGVTAHEKFGHPSCSVILWWPSKQASGETLTWYFPMRAIPMLAKPSRNLIRCLRMVNFGDDEWLLIREKACAST